MLCSSPLSVWWVNKYSTLVLSPHINEAFLKKTSSKEIGLSDQNQFLNAALISVSLRYLFKFRMGLGHDVYQVYWQLFLLCSL